MTMKILLSGVAAVALAACNAQTGNESAGNNVSATNEAAPENAAGSANETAPASNTSASAELSRDYIVGRWTESDDCADAMDFRADGTLHTPMGEGGRWELNGDQLVNVGNPRALTVTVIDANTMETSNPEGTRRRVTRCR